MDGEKEVRRYHAPYEAELAAAHLRSIGIEARVHNAVLVGMNPLWDTALGGVKVMVPVRQAKRARHALAKLEAPGEKDAVDAELHSATNEADAIAARAFRAAILAIFCFPVGFNIYSFWLLGKIDAELSPRGRRTKTATVIINVATIAATFLAIVATLIAPARSPR